MASNSYFEEIEAHFAMRRQTPFILSAKDWVLMKSWHDEGIPLPVVIEAIDAVFDKTEKKVNSLSYCRHAVKELWDDRKNLYVGEGETTPETAIAETLAALASQLETTELGAPFAPRVRALTGTVPKVEQQLLDLESELLDAAIATSDAAALREEIARSMGDTSRIDEKTIARTIEANLRRVIRERFELPRLTLF
jgi:hypothetical protein